MSPRYILIGTLYLQEESDKMLRISHSQIKTFHNCEKRWEFNYITKLVPKKKKASFAVGTLVHEALHSYYQIIQQGIKPGSAIAVDHVINFFQSDLDLGELDASALEVYNKAVLTVIRYIRDYSPSVDAGIAVVAVEQKFEIPLVTPKGREFILEGIVDLLLRDQLGQLWVLDHKSFGQPQFWTESQLQLDTQMTTYCAAIRTLGYNPHGVIVNQLNTYSYKDYAAVPINKLFKRSSVLRSQKELDFVLLNYGRAVDEMQDKVENNHDFVHKFDKDCSFCQYSKICSYIMKGIDPVFVIANDYKRREDEKPRPSSSNIKLQSILEEEDPEE